jgi:hypothetical protein
MFQVLRIAYSSVMAGVAQDARVDAYQPFISRETQLDGDDNASAVAVLKYILEISMTKAKARTDDDSRSVLQQVWVYENERLQPELKQICCGV